jgi:hypothetical protein
MKTRTGWVSNSSSTSFIVKGTDELIRLDTIVGDRMISVFSLKIILEQIAEFEKARSKLISFLRGGVDYPNCLDFIADGYQNPIELDLGDLDPETTWITEPINRDWASTVGLDFLEVFQGDL